MTTNANRKDMRNRTGHDSRCLCLAGFVAVSLLASLGGCGTEVPPDEPTMVGRWVNTISGAGNEGALDAELSFTENEYSLSWRFLLVTADFDTMPVVHSEQGSYRFEGEDRESAFSYYSSGGWCGTIFFTPDGGDAWNCGFCIADGWYRSDLDLSLTGIMTQGVEHDIEFKKVTQAPAAGSGWQVRTTGFMPCLAADLRGEGRTRAYGIAPDGGAALNPTYTIHNDDTSITDMRPRATWGVFEYTHAAGSWTTAPVTPPGLDVSGPPVAGNCRPDGKMRLYACTVAGRLVEISRNAGAWTCDTVLVPGDSLLFPDSRTPLVAADTRGDGRHSLILPCEPGQPGSPKTLHEIRFGVNGWERMQIAEVSGNGDPAGEYTMVAADIREEGRASVYTMTVDGSILEYRLDAGSWVPTAVDSSSLSSATSHGTNGFEGLWAFPDGHGGSLLLVSGSDDSTANMWQIDYSGSAWEQTIVAPAFHGIMCGGTTRGDGVFRVYIVDHSPGDEGLVEISPGQAGYQRTGKIRSNIADAVFVGDCRGDGTERIYLTDFWDSYEISYEQ